MRNPRTHSEAIRPMILGFLKEEEEERTPLFNEPYILVLTCKDIGEISEHIYDRHYSKQQVHFLSTVLGRI